VSARRRFTDRANQDWWRIFPAASGARLKVTGRNLLYLPSGTTKPFGIQSNLSNTSGPTVFRCFLYRIAKIGGRTFGS